MRRVSNQPIRMAAGAFFLNAGIEKWSADEDRATGLHKAASSAFPFFEKIPATQFAKGLAAAEIGIGSALVLPLFSDRQAGLVLTPFAAGLMWMYAQNESMHKPESLRPSGAGTALAKDIWLVGIGLTLLASGRRRSKTRRQA